MRARTPAFSPNTTASSKQTQRGCLAQAYLKIRIPEIGGEVPQLWRTEILGATEVTSQRSRRGPDTPPRLSPSVSWSGPSSGARSTAFLGAEAVQLGLD